MSGIKRLKRIKHILGQKLYFLKINYSRRISVFLGLISVKVLKHEAKFLINSKTLQNITGLVVGSEFNILEYGQLWLLCSD